MRTISVWVIGIGLAVTLGAATPQEPKPTEKKLTPEQQEKLKEREKHRQESTDLEKVGKFQEAVAVAENMLVIEREVLGNTHADVAESLERIGRLRVRLEKWAEARAVRQEALELRTALHGKDDWRVTDVRIALADVTLFEKMTAADRAATFQAIDLHAEGRRLQSEGKTAAARERWEKALEIRQKTLGEEHPDYARTLNNLGWTSEARKAEPLLKRALEISQKSLGEIHPFTATVLINLGLHYSSAGEYAKAEPLFRQIVVIRKKTFGEANPEYALSLASLAWLYEKMGENEKAEPLYRQSLEAWKKAGLGFSPDAAYAYTGLGELHLAKGEYAKAEELYRQALTIRKKELGEAHPEYAESLKSLGFLYLARGQFGKAESLLREALAVAKKVFGETHPTRAQYLLALGAFYADTGEPEKAEPLLLEALAITKKVFGETHFEFAKSLTALGLLYLRMLELKKTGEAELCLKQALEIRRKSLGEAHPLYAQSLMHLGFFYYYTFNYEKAEPLLSEAVAISRKTNRLGVYAECLLFLAGMYGDVGEYRKAEPLLSEALTIYGKAFKEDPNYANLLWELGWGYYNLREYVKAEPLLRESIDVLTRSLSRAADGQTEKQQIDFAHRTRGILSDYLSVTAPDVDLNRPGVTLECYTRVLGWKGQTFLRQRRQMELIRAAANPETTALTADLMAVTRRLATRSGQMPQPDQADIWKTEITELATRRDRLEADLALKSVAFRGQRERETLTPERIRKLLPPKTILIDFLVYVHRSPNPKMKGKWVFDEQLVAFVVRPDKEVVRVELGAFKPIAKAIEDWRENWLKRPHPIMGDDDPAIVLRDKLWAPLAKHLDGIETVLISPDRELSKLPFGALPGSKDNVYLIEELAIAILPVPQFLPDLLEPLPKADPSLLIIGEVDYGADPGKPTKPDTTAVATKRSAARGERGATWKALPATREEAVSITDSFRRAFRKGKVEELREGDATEDEVRQQIVKHRWVHFATHGFFAPPTVKALGSGTPTDRTRMELDRGAATGHLPGLLSGLVLAGANRPIDPLSDADDGILTASEITTLDLRHVDLAVLSACETGLGPVAGGEGVLGLQRAFQVAGARTVVATLWSVDDEATRKLMVRTYENWLKGKQTKLEGLIQAQRELLKDGVSRGLVKVTEKPKPGIPARTPPYFWAAFILSGNWR